MNWLQRDDILYDDKLDLLRQLGVASVDCAELQKCLSAARVLVLREAELPLLSSVKDFYQPICPRNEAAALALLIRREHELCHGDAERASALHAAAANFAYADIGADSCLGEHFPPGTPEADLERHMQQPSRSRICSIRPANFTAADGVAQLRGAAADRDVPAGAPVLAMRASLCITAATAERSSFGRALAALGLNAEQQPDALLLLWTMRERHDAESRWRHTWATLPASGFGSCLSAPAPLLCLATGTPLYDEAIHAREHISASYAQLQPYISALLAAYPQHLQPDWFTQSAYVWATELWYAYAMELETPAGERHAALVPLALLANHSTAPNCVDFSRLRRAGSGDYATTIRRDGGGSSGADDDDCNSSGGDEHCGSDDGQTDDQLELVLTPFRALRPGQQLLLSYGPHSNAKLALFYGFALTDNPCDDAELGLPDHTPWDCASVRGTGQLADCDSRHGDDHSSETKVLYAELSQQVGLGTTAQHLHVCRTKPLPPLLLPALRLAHASAAELCAVQHRLSAAHPALEAAQATSAAGARSSSSSRLQRAWRDAALAQALLGEPLSPDNERAVQQTLSAMLDTARAPYAAALARIARRRQLTAALADKLASTGSAAGTTSTGFDEGAFLRMLETYCGGMAELFDAVAVAAGLQDAAGSCLA